MVADVQALSTFILAMRARTLVAPWCLHGGTPSRPTGAGGSIKEEAVARGPRSDRHHARIEAAQRKLVDCDRRLAGYQKTLDAGADPKLKAKLYAELGITVRYDPSTRIVAAPIASGNRVCNCECRRTDYPHEHTSDAQGESPAQGGMRSRRPKTQLVQPGPGAQPQRDPRPADGGSSDR